MSLLPRLALRHRDGYKTDFQVPSPWKSFGPGQQWTLEETNRNKEPHIERFEVAGMKRFHGSDRVSGLHTHVI